MEALILVATYTRKRESWEMQNSPYIKASEGAPFSLHPVIRGPYFLDHIADLAEFVEKERTDLRKSAASNGWVLSDISIARVPVLPVTLEHYVKQKADLLDAEVNKLRNEIAIRQKEKEALLCLGFTPSPTVNADGTIEAEFSEVPSPSSKDDDCPF